MRSSSQIKSVIRRKFAELKHRGEAALIPYVTAGDPSSSLTTRIVEALVDSGADIVELGLPFSDPIADGPAIQGASVRALASGTTPKIVMEIAKTVRHEIDIPLVLMTYFNPVYKARLPNFMRRAHQGGFNGIIVPDLSIEESGPLKEAASQHYLDTIFMASPMTTQARLRKIIQQSSGFLYVISLLGVTGARDNLQEYSVSLVRKFKDFTQDNLPIAVGFGISKPEHVRTLVKAGADGVIVGSALVEVIAGNLSDPDKMLAKLREYTSSLKDATKI